MRVQLLNTHRRWLRTVWVESVSSLATSDVVRPDAIRSRISRWRGVSRGCGTKPMSSDGGWRAPNARMRTPTIASPHRSGSCWARTLRRWPLASNEGGLEVGRLAPLRSAAELRLDILACLRVQQLGEMVAEQLGVRMTGGSFRPRRFMRTNRPSTSCRPRGHREVSTSHKSTPCKPSGMTPTS